MTTFHDGGTAGASLHVRQEANGQGGRSQRARSTMIWRVARSLLHLSIAAAPTEGRTEVYNNPGPDLAIRSLAALSHRAAGHVSCPPGFSFVAA